jgi:hypothetical protein
VYDAPYALGAERASGLSMHVRMKILATPVAGRAVRA